MIKKFINFIKFQNLKNYQRWLIWILVPLALIVIIVLGCYFWGYDFLGYLTKILGVVGVLI